MPEHCVRVVKGKTELVKLLIGSTDNSPFQIYADALLFAAVVGARQDRWIPLDKISKTEPEPISIEIFVTRGYDPVMKSIAIAATENINVNSLDLADFEHQRISIFEEYANGGLDLLARELCGAVDYTERISLMISTSLDSCKTDSMIENSSEEFDLRKLL